MKITSQDVVKSFFQVILKTQINKTSNTKTFYLNTKTLDLEDFLINLNLFFIIC